MNSRFEHCKSMLTKFKWLPPLLARISIGVVFAQSGWGKLQNMERVVEYFTSLGIPFATIQAPFVAGLEFSGGLLLIVGFATRLTSVPLIGVMFVAILTAKKEEIGSLSDIFGFSEYLYIVLLVWLIIEGAGAASLDKLISQKAKGKL